MLEQGVVPLRARRWRALLALPVVALLAVSAYGVAGIHASEAAEPPSEDFAGFTKVAISPSYVVVVNVLPAEEMFTRREFEESHPTVGELVVDGRPTPRLASSRHTEAHVYSRGTGLVVSDVHPTLKLIDHTSGKVTAVDATLMQDVVIGAPDLHFGSNVVIQSGHEFTLVVTVGREEVSVDGVLD